METERYDRMPYRRSGRSGLRLPAISLGLWHNFGSVDPQENARAILLRALDLGVTHFDLANNYGPVPGSAEETFGRILRRDLAGHRDELVVSTKAGYGMWPGPYGYSMLERTPEAGLLPVLEEEGVGCIVYSPLAQGLLTDRYLDGIPPDSRAARPTGFLSEDEVTDARRTQLRALNAIARARGQSLAQLAIAWVLRQPTVTSALIGASRVQQLEDNVAALDNLALSDDELRQIDEVLAEAA
jgi:aryl-alcohol dehydrogenase-like predicted oxidoreductase